jgi:transposase-like protein
MGGSPVASKHFQNPARREWWRVHVEAWRNSGLSQRLYCRQHRLTETTFSRWLKVLDGEKVVLAKAELKHEERRERRRRKKFRLSSDKRCQAVQAFWAMHVEALNWSGMSAANYAVALRISADSLRRWRDLLDAGEVEVDWPAHLHPSARPLISSGVSSAAKAPPAEARLTKTRAGSSAMDRRSNRRQFSDAEKLAIVRESMVRGATVAGICRRHDIVTSMLFRWRVQFGFTGAESVKLAAVEVREAHGGRHAAALVLHDLLRTPDGMTAVELPDGRRVFAPTGADPETVRRHVNAREATS